MTPTLHWLREGLRAGFLLRPRTSGWSARPRDVLVVALFATAVQLLLDRLAIDGAADFSLRGWLVSWWATGFAVMLLWVLLSKEEDAPPAGGVATWFALWMTATLLPVLFSHALWAAAGQGILPRELPESAFFSWSAYLLAMAWALAIGVRLGKHVGLQGSRLAGLAAGLALIFATGAWQVPDRAWEAEPGPYVPPPRLSLSEESFEAQQALFQRQVAALAPQRAGVPDVYGLVFAPYAREDVFLRESQLVADLLAQRFDAEGRVLRLVNNVQTADSLPWATPRNLKRAIEAIAARMDRDNDLLVVYLTSHGARDFKLAAVHPPLDVQPVTPAELRLALDEAGIRHRVVAISACYSGGWVGPLASDTTLVMTAADAEHTSYGCGRGSELTYFGRALFGEQLRSTHSFEQAFAAAVPVIRQREVDAGKPDGFSNPQISVGERIRPLLKTLEQRLQATGAAQPSS